MIGLHGDRAGFFERMGQGGGNRLSTILRTLQCTTLSYCFLKQPGLFVLYSLHRALFMKMISGLTRFKKWPAPRQISAFVLVLTTALFFAGCSKHTTPVVQTTADQNTNQPAADQPTTYQQPSTTTPVVATPQPPAAPDLRELDRGLIRWIVGNRRPPKNFADFAATAGVAIPPPPAGKQYFIDKTMHIQLVDR
jgi:hypothetical protein